MLLQLDLEKFPFNSANSNKLTNAITIPCKHENSEKLIVVFILLPQSSCVCSTCFADAKNFQQESKTFAETRTTAEDDDDHQLAGFSLPSDVPIFNLHVLGVVLLCCPQEAYTTSARTKKICSKQQYIKIGKERHSSLYDR